MLVIFTVFPYTWVFLLVTELALWILWKQNSLHLNKLDSLCLSGFFDTFAAARIALATIQLQIARPRLVEAAAPHRDQGPGHSRNLPLVQPDLRREVFYCIEHAHQVYLRVYEACI